MLDIWQGSEYTPVVFEMWQKRNQWQNSQELYDPDLLRFEQNEAKI